MAVRGIEYVELYASDKLSVVDYFTRALGFTYLAESTDHGQESALLRQGEAQLIVTAGPGTRTFLDAHGDGIADIALPCDDVATSREAARAAGAVSTDSTSGSPAVSAFGGVCHTLLPVSAAPGPPR